MTYLEVSTHIMTQLTRFVVRKEMSEVEAAQLAVRLTEALLSAIPEPTEPEQEFSPGGFPL